MDSLFAYYLTSKATSRLQQPVVEDTKTEFVGDREAFLAFTRASKPRVKRRQQYVERYSIYPVLRIT